MKPSVVMTSDGSHTVFNPILDETFHSTHGAIQESRHVFIEAGLNAWYTANKDAPAIFEVGFGTGLNALLACLWADENEVIISYTSIDKYPLPKIIYSKLNYGDILASEHVYNEILNSEWELPSTLSSMQLFKKKADALAFTPEPFDICFFDAFAFSKQPEIWSIEVLRRITESMNPGGLFVTYAARGQLKRDLKSLGLRVETLPGPPGKYEMVRAWKN